MSALDPLETLGVAFGIVAVWLTVRENVWCWPTGLLNVGLYILVFYRAKLYADMGLQVVYVALCLYGWWAWLHGGRHHGPLRVGRTPRAWALGLGLAGVAAWLALATYLARRTDAALPYWDSATTSFSLVAQVLQARKWIESWAVWIAVDLVYLGIYVAKGLYQTTVLYAIFLGLAVAGWRAWRRSLVAVGEAAAVPG